MQQTFYNCTNLKTANIFLETQNVLLVETFRGCNNLTSINITNMDSVQNMQSTFMDCSELVTIPIIGSNVNQMNTCFRNCQKLTGDIYIKSNQVTNAYYCFYQTALSKTVHIPFTYPENGVSTATYNTFSQYYGSGQNGVTLVNYTDLYS